MDPDVRPTTGVESRMAAPAPALLRGQPPARVLVRPAARARARSTGPFGSVRSGLRVVLGLVASATVSLGFLASAVGAASAVPASSPMSAPPPAPASSPALAPTSGQLIAPLLGGGLGDAFPVATLGPGSAPGDSGTPSQPGPPYPDPTPGRYVYDQAGVFRPDTIAKVQADIEAIRARTGAEIVVYTQVKPGVDTNQAEQDAIALIDQWGVGRKGFDDGLAILFDLDQSKQHGQVQLYAGPGYAAAFLNNQERQAIYENDMLPLLKQGDLDGALLAAMANVDANATPEHAATLEQARQINAVIGLVGAPIAFVLLVGWVLWAWLRYGRDPHYLDDPSILMPAPPADLTPASGALVFDGQSSRHTLTTAMLDLASRGELAFRPEHHMLGKDRVSIDITKPDPSDARVALNRRPPLGPAETFALGRLQGLAEPDEDGTPHISPTALLAFGTSVSDFDKRLEAHVVQKGWLRESPRAATQRWQARGIVELILGGIGFVLAANIPSDGLLLISLALLGAGVVTLFLARFMPARTLAGATIRAMLAAYRRTLQLALAQARSMDAVVESKALPWLQTPDQAVVWGVALGLRTDVETVIERTSDDVREGRMNAGVPYFPFWYGPRASFASGGGGGLAPGLFSSGSAIPNFGNMVAAIGTIGNSPASSGGGGFGGGGSGGGGGGAGGGF